MKRETLHLLFSRSARWKLSIGTLGNLMSSLLDAAGVLLIVPLMGVLSGASLDEGVLGWMSDLFGDPSRETLAIYLALLTFGAFLLKGVTVILFRWWLLGVLFREETAMSTRLMRHFMQVPYGVHLRRNSAEILHVVTNAVSRLFALTVNGVMNVISETLGILAVSAALIIVVPIPALLLLAYFLIVAACIYWIVRPAARRSSEVVDASSIRVWASAAQALGGLKEIRIRHKVEFFLARYSDAKRDLASAQHVASFLAELPKYVFEVVFIVGIAGVSVFVFATMSPAASLTALAALAAGGFRLLPNLSRLVGAMNQIRLGQSSGEIVLGHLREAQRSSDTIPDAESTSQGRLEVVRDVRMEGVSFVHEGREQPAVDDVSLTIPIGESIALVGPSGAGKSTIVDLLLGLYEPSTGRILVDDENIARVLPGWQRSVGLVPQEVFLLDDDLKANIAFGEKPVDVDLDRLAEAVAGAQLSDLIAQLPDGIDTRVGERGIRLSGGQRQRIGIARALYSKPELLILDEATSALDNETERLIADTIAHLHGRVTIIIVAHRLSTVRDVDQVIFLKDGRVAARGGFQELRQASEDFARLVDLGSLT